MRNQPRRSTGDRRPVNIRLDPKMYQILRYLAWRDDKSMSFLIDMALQEKYGKTEVPK